MNEETVAHGGLLSQKKKDYFSINIAFKTLRPESITLAL
jgi:hypothetical protein